MKKILLFVPLLVLLAMPVFAYQEFSSNSNIDTTDNYLSIYNNSNAVVSSAYNSTCYNMTGCLLTITNYSSLSAVSLSNPSWQNKNISSSLSELNRTFILLPANKEGLIGIHYLFNATQSNQPFVIAYLGLYGDSSIIIYNTTSLNATPNTWHNATIIVPASTSPRYMSVAFFWTPDNPATTMAIDRFAFYTYDLVENRPDTFTTSDVEGFRYCGVGATATYFNKRNTTENHLMNQMVINNSDKNLCCAYQYNQTTRASRCDVSSGGGNTVYNSSRFAFVYDANYEQQLLIHSISASTLTYSGWFSTSVNPCSSVSYIYFNGAGYFNWNCKGLNTTNNSWIYHRNYDWSNRNFSGSLWYVRCNGGDCGGGWNSLNYSLFIETTSSCENAGLRCDNQSNRQYFVLNDCTIANNSYQSCGGWGCNSDYTGCAYGNYGCYCDAGNLSYHCIDELNATSTYYACGYDAQNYTRHCYSNVYDVSFNRTRGIVACFSDTEYINAQHGIFNNTNTSIDIFVNPMNNVAMIIGGLFGSQSLPLNQNISALIFSLMITIAFVVAGHKFGGLSGRDIGMMSMVVMVIALALFTMLGWLNPMFMVLLMVVIGLMLAKMIGV